MNAIKYMIRAMYGLLEFTLIPGISKRVIRRLLTTDINKPFDKTQTNTNQVLKLL